MIETAAEGILRHICILTHGNVHLCPIVLYDEGDQIHEDDVQEFHVRSNNVRVSKIWISVIDTSQPIFTVIRAVQLALI